MSELTPIPAEETVTIPATEEEVYDRLYIKNLRFIANGSGGMKVIGNMVPYNGVKVLDEPITPIVIDDIFAAVMDEERPIELRTVLGQTVEGIIQSVVSEIAYQKAKAKAKAEAEAEVPEEDPIV